MDGTIRLVNNIRPKVTITDLSDEMREEEVVTEEVVLPKTDVLIGVYVVLDRESGTEALPTFFDVFSTPQGRHGSKCDLYVRRDRLGQFKVLMREKMVVCDSTDGSVLKLDCFLRFMRGNVINVTFRDNQIAMDGHYNNVKENALILYVLWEGCNRKIYVNINTHIVYLH